jgi:hypothetical protein
VPHPSFVCVARVLAGLTDSRAKQSRAAAAFETGKDPKENSRQSFATNHKRGENATTNAQNGQPTVQHMKRIVIHLYLNLHPFKFFSAGVSASFGEARLQQRRRSR